MERGKLLPALLSFLLSFLLVSRWVIRVGATSTEAYKYMSYGEIVAKLKALAQTYPDLVDIDNVQDKYDVASPGTCGEDGACKVWFIKITNKRTMGTVGSAESQLRPRILFSGEVHGNERVGPMAVMALAEALLEGYAGSGEGSGCVVCSL